MFTKFEEFSRTWYLFSDTLGLLRQERQRIVSTSGSEFKIAAINASILLHLTAIVEGAVNSLLYTELKSSKVYKQARTAEDSKVIRLYESQLIYLQKATWSTLCDDISKTIFGFKLPEVYHSDWAAIKNLFEFRNILAHGGLVVQRFTRKLNLDREIEVDQEFQSEYITKRKLFEFLFEKKLIQDMQEPGILNWQYINTSVSEYFESHAKAFLLALYKKYQIDHSLGFFSETDLEVIGKL